MLADEIAINKGNGAYEYTLGGGVIMLRQQPE